MDQLNEKASVENRFFNYSVSAIGNAEHLGKQHF